MGEVYEVEADSASEREWEGWEEEFGGREAVVGVIRAFGFDPIRESGFGTGAGAGAGIGSGSGAPPFLPFGYSELGLRRGSGPGVGEEVEDYGAGPGSRYVSGSSVRDRSATIGASTGTATGAGGTSAADVLVDVEEEGSGSSPRTRSKSVTTTSTTGAGGSGAARGGGGEDTRTMGRLGAAMVAAPYYLSGGHKFGM